MQLYHSTNEHAAEAILQNGFKDNECGNFPPGVFLSNCPLDVNEGTRGFVLMSVQLDIEIDRLFYEFEIIEDGKTYREFVLPASIVNAHGSIRRLTDDEVAAAVTALTYWNEYPPGEPERTLAELRNFEAEQKRDLGLS